MKSFVIAAATAGLLVASAQHVSVQGPTAPKNPLIGAWKIIESSDGPVTQASLVIFTARHYSLVRTAGSEPRTRFKDPRNISAEEKVRAYDSLTAHTGTYEVKGDRFITTRILAKNPDLTGQQDAPRGFKVDGSTLTIIGTDGKTFIRLTRVE